MKLSKQFYLLAAIGLLDLFSTIWLVSHRGAAEANPLMARFLELGVGVFVLVKLLFLVVPLVVLEWSRRRTPVFARRAMNVATAAYLSLYILGVVRANVRPIIAEKSLLMPDAKALSVWNTLQDRIAVKRKLGLIDATGRPVAPAAVQTETKDSLPSAT